jgi:hypothetical protein
MQTIQTSGIPLTNTFFHELQVLAMEKSQSNQDEEWLTRDV